MQAGEGSVGENCLGSGLVKPTPCRCHAVMPLQETTAAEPESLQGYWLGPACFTVVSPRAPEPSLSLRLEIAARQLRLRPEIAGALSAFREVAAYWRIPPRDRAAAEALVISVVRDGLAATIATESEALEPLVFPVAYNGPDLGEVADHCGLSEAEVATRHSNSVYTVAAIGFLPHFGYLQGMDTALGTPRRSSPRARVPEGAVGIAGTQTGVYPRESPGGWQVIGQVPAEAVRRLCPQLRPGRYVRFEAT